jgi:hypothetical protein
MLKEHECINSIQDFIDLLEKVKYTYGNDTPIKIINPIDHDWCGNIKFEGIGTQGSIMLSGLYIFGCTKEDVEKKAREFVEQNKDEPIGIYDDYHDIEKEREGCERYNDGLFDGYVGCMQDILNKLNVGK